MSGAILKGTVKWFNNQKGFGFIVREETNEDIFVHYSAINVDGYKTLTEGDHVEFELIKGDNGYQALNVTNAKH